MNKTRKIRNKSEVTTASVECEYMLKENNKSWKERKITLNSPNQCMAILICCVDFQKSPSSDLIWRETKPLASFFARLATSRSKKRAPLAYKLVRSTCGKSIYCAEVLGSWGKN